MHLLLCITPDQVGFLKTFSALAVLQGHQVSVMTQTPLTLSEIKLKCEKVGINGILLANPEILRKALDALPDYREPPTSKKITLDDYQGSFFQIKGIDTVVLNPPEQLMTVAYGRYVFSRFIQKITRPESWFPQTKFVWGVATEDRIEYEFHRFSTARLIAIDIETPDPDTPQHSINCVSFTAYWTDHTTYSLVIPFTSMYWITWIRKFCALAAPKVLQGGQYDAVRLLRFNIPIFNWLYDTLNLSHCHYSELPKRLDFVAAFALRHVRFWKDDGKSGDLQEYYRYCAQDGWATINACLSLMLELPDWALANYLQEFPLNFPCIHCELEGWRVDPERFMVAKAQQAAINAKALASIQKMLKAPNYNPGSHIQNKLVFKILGCGDIGKTDHKTGVFKQSSDEASMKKAEFRHPLNARIIGAIRDYKKSDKLESTYCNPEKIWQFDAKNWRLFYRLNTASTDTARLASAESSFWIGYQIQNVKRGPQIKQYLISDPGWELGEPDAEQSEARCTFYLAGEEKGIALVESGKDYHCYNAQLFFGFKYEDLWDEKTKKCKTPEAKYIRDEPAKRTNHGANYNMTGGVMLDTMGPKAVARVKAVLVGQKLISPLLTLKDVCTFCLGQYSKTYVRIKGLWYPEIMRTIELTRKLVSPLGWTRHFFGDPRNNKHHLNAAVAHGPQNLSVGIINRCFYKIWWESIYGVLRNRVRIKAQIHDSIPFQYRSGDTDAVERVKEFMRLPVKVVGADKKERLMVIPVGMSYGKQRWSELK
jgi:hypothetical protein